MIRLGSITLYWPGEQALRQERDDARMAESRAEDRLQRSLRAREFERREFTNRMLKATGLYAGPLAGWQPADGTGFVLAEDKVVGYSLTRRQDRHGVYRGMLSLEATVEIVGIDHRPIYELTHVEWEGIKWKAANARISIERDAHGFGMDSRYPATEVVEISLEAFIQFHQPGDAP